MCMRRICFYVSFNVCVLEFNIYTYICMHLYRNVRMSARKYPSMNLCAVVFEYVHSGGCA